MSGRLLLDAQTEAAIKQRATALERATGVEVVAAVVARADSYPEIPWKAFALGASLASLGCSVVALLEPEWEALAAVAETAVATLAAGASAALATVWIPPWARLFLPRARRRAETLQCAQAMFLEAGLQRTQRRDGILLLVALFEREVVVLGDRGVQTGLGTGGFEPVIRATTGPLARGNLGAALLDGLGQLEAALAARGFRARPEEINEIADDVIQRGSQ